MSAAGEEAVHYFERTNPDYPRFGAGSTSDNTAEWIVDLTTKVQCLLNMKLSSCSCQNALRWLSRWLCSL